MTVICMHVPPHTFWGWLVEVPIGLAILWILGCLLVTIVDELHQEPPRPVKPRETSAWHIAFRPVQATPGPSAREIALREQETADRAGQAIDEVYRNAETEVERQVQIELAMIRVFGPQRAAEIRASRVLDGDWRC
jgi:hypothetical protein